MTEGKKVLVVLNPKSGQSGQAEALRETLKINFAPPGWALEIHETTGEEDIPAICRRACDEGASLVIAAGGDGTLASVANGMVGSRVPLGILPMGTGNDLARALLIPLKLKEAADLLVGDHAFTEIDALSVEDRHFFSNVSVGVSPRLMRKTKSEHKKRIGRLAYLIPFMSRTKLIRVRPYTLIVDGQPMTVRAVEIMISNTTLLEKPPYIFGPPDTLIDGQLEVYLVTARRFRHYLQMGWDLLRRRKSTEKVHHFAAQRSVRVESEHAHLVQADGELIGRTPVEVQIVPRALRVVVPEATASSMGGRAHESCSQGSPEPSSDRVLSVASTGRTASRTENVDPSRNPA